jgi:hypothetical protein
MRRLFSLALWGLPVFLALAPFPARAQEVSGGRGETAAAEVSAAEARPAEGAGATNESDQSASRAASAPSARLPKVAIVVVGDPDPVLVAAALEIEGSLLVAGSVRLPADGALRAALRGEPGAPDDGLDEVRRERRRLGFGEASDAPLLARLGRRAGAVLVVAVREGDGRPEAVALDVRSAQFFEGTLALGEPAPSQIVPFVTRRARAAARGATAEASATGEADGETARGTLQESTTEARPPREGNWIEVHWPYLAAGGLLVAAIAFVVVTALIQDNDVPPMLRFQPGAPL